MARICDADGLGTHWWFERLDGEWSPPLIDFLRNEITSFNDTYTRFTDSSLIGRLNIDKRLPNPPQELLDMLAFAHKLYEVSEGVFDISVGGELFKRGYGSRTHTADLTQHFWDSATYNTEEITIPSTAVVDFGGFGKGWLIDKLAVMLEQKGLSQFVINGGGDIYVQSDTPIAFALEHPLQNQMALGEVIISKGALAVSSTIKRRWEHDGTSYHHIIDPTTKTSSDSDVLSSYVQAPTALIADVLATISIIRPELRPKLEKKFDCQIQYYDKINGLL